MGLDTTHDCWHGPYSSFYRWRLDLTRAAGWHLEPDGPYEWPREVNTRALTDANFMGEWESIPEDPLVVLIAHSDCGGSLPVDVLLPLAERLEGLAERMTSEQGAKPAEWLTEFRHAKLPPRANYDGSRAATLRFAAGLRRAAAAGEPVEFH